MLLGKIWLILTHKRKHNMHRNSGLPKRRKSIKYTSSCTMGSSRDMYGANKCQAQHQDGNCRYAAFFLRGYVISLERRIIKTY